MRRPLVMGFATAPFWISFNMYMRKILFSFLSVHLIGTFQESNLRTRFHGGLHSQPNIPKLFLSFWFQLADSFGKYGRGKSRRIDAMWVGVRKQGLKSIPQMHITDCSAESRCTYICITFTNKYLQHLKLIQLLSKKKWSCIGAAT